MTHTMVYSMKMCILNHYLLHYLINAMRCCLLVSWCNKRIFAWGFRVGFMTFGTSDQTTKEVLEAKVKGLIRRSDV